jgi:hypothetical protein
MDGGRRMYVVHQQSQLILYSFALNISSKYTLNYFREQDALRRMRFYVPEAF